MTEQQPTNDSTASARERDYTPPRLTGYGRLEVDTTGVAGDATDGADFQIISNL